MIYKIPIGTTVWVSQFKRGKIEEISKQYISKQYKRDSKEWNAEYILLSVNWDELKSEKKILYTYDFVVPLIDKVTNIDYMEFYLPYNIGNYARLAVKNEDVVLIKNAAKNVYKNFTNKRK